MPDDLEAQYGTDPNEADSDGDRVTTPRRSRTASTRASPTADGDGRRMTTSSRPDTDPLNPDSGQRRQQGRRRRATRSLRRRPGQVVQGAACGDSTAVGLPERRRPRRARQRRSTSLGQILTGLLAVGDIRDFVAAILRGQWGDAAWAAVGVVP